MISFVYINKILYGLYYGARVIWCIVDSCLPAGSRSPEVMQDIGSVMQSRMQNSADDIAASTLQAAHEGAQNMKMAPQNAAMWRS